MRETLINTHISSFLEWCEINDVYLILSWNCGHTLKITPFFSVRGISYQGKRPTGFKGNNLHLLPLSDTLLEWIHTEFVPCFDKDIFKWTISVQNLPEELKCHLNGQTNN